MAKVAVAVDVDAAPPAHLHLSEDVIAAEILPRLPVKSLLRFKSVCRSWHALISDPAFASLHLDRYKKNRKLAVMPYEGKEINLYQLSLGQNYAPLLFGHEFDDEEAGARFALPQHSSDGLLLLNYGTQLVVCNPSTRESATILLPGASISADNRPTRGTAGFGLVPGAANVYKVVRYYFHRYRNSLCFEILALGGVECAAWRTVAEDLPYSIDTWSDPVSTSGGMVYFKMEDSFTGLFLEFDLKHEKFAVIQAPPGVHAHWLNAVIRAPPGVEAHWLDEYWLQELDGRLCVIGRFNMGRRQYFRFKVWTYYKQAGSNTSSVNAWHDAFTIVFPDGRPPPRFIILGSRHGRILLHVEDGGRQRLEYYDPASKSFQPALYLACYGFEYWKGPNHPPFCFPDGRTIQPMCYVESLVPVLTTEAKP